MGQLFRQETARFKDSGKRQDFGTGAVRDVQDNKGRMDLTPPAANMLESMVYDIGCKKYGDRNWEKGIPIMRFLDSAQRHVGKYISGFRDEPHLAMAAWNLKCALQTAAWVHAGLRPQALYDVPNNFVEAQVGPLSALEIEYLEAWIPAEHRARPPLTPELAEATPHTNVGFAGTRCQQT